MLLLRFTAHVPPTGSFSSLRRKARASRRSSPTRATWASASSKARWIRAPANPHGLRRRPEFELLLVGHVRRPRWRHSICERRRQALQPQAELRLRFFQADTIRIEAGFGKPGPEGSRRPERRLGQHVLDDHRNHLWDAQSSYLHEGWSQLFRSRWMGQRPG